MFTYSRVTITFRVNEALTILLTLLHFKSKFQELIFPSCFVKYDHQTQQPVRNNKGFCVRAACGEPGLMITKLTPSLQFDGYKGDRAQNEKKIMRNVFKKGDTYCNSGDVLVADNEYFLYFTDRTGDTFRYVLPDMIDLFFALFCFIFCIRYCY